MSIQSDIMGKRRRDGTLPAEQHLIVCTVCHELQVNVCFYMNHLSFPKSSRKAVAIAAEVWDAERITGLPLYLMPVSTAPTPATAAAMASSLTTATATYSGI